MRLLVAALVLLAVSSATSISNVYVTCPNHASTKCSCRKTFNSDGKLINECEVDVENFPSPDYGPNVEVQYEPIKFTMKCFNRIMDVSNLNLPEMSQETAVDEIEFYNCSAPLNGSYMDVLRKMNLTVTKTLLLSNLPAQPPLEYSHLSGLSINELEITAECHDLHRPKLNYTKGIRLRTLKLNNVIPDPKEFLQLPVELETLELNYTKSLNIQCKLCELGKSNWIEELKSLRKLTVLEESNVVIEKCRDLEYKVSLPKFEALPNLTMVNLQYVPLNESSLGGTLNGSSVKHLVMRSCGLNDLPETLFEGANLTTLNLSLYNLTNLKADVFSPLQWLTELNLDSTQVDGGALVNIVSSLPRLEKLEVKENPLSSLCDEGNPKKFNLPYSLRKLSLKESNITRICPEWMENKNLVNIDLSHNNIRDLEYNDLAKKSYVMDSTATVTINLSQNTNLRIINVMEDKRTSEDSNGRMRAKVVVELDYLQCDYNSHLLHQLLRNNSWLKLEGDIYDSADELHCPDNDSCADLKGYCTCAKRPRDNATVVRCAGALPPAPRWPQGLLALHVAPGTLNHVPRVSLVELHASLNNITNLDEEDIPDTLRVLDLSHNNIRYISETAAQKLAANGASLSVYLKGNQLACNCTDAPALDLLEQLVRDLNETECTDGIKVLDKIRELSDLCAVHWMLPLVVVMILLTVVLMLLRFRPLIKLLLFRMNCGRRFIVMVKDDDDEKKVDVFLSYAHHDLDYLKELKNGLEIRGYSTLEHNRDWQPGDPILEQIASSVKKSRRTLLLVSDHFINSKWAVAEFHAAHGHALKRQTSRVLVVLYDLRHPEKLPLDLRMYLKYNTYLDWRDPNFWTKLCNAMPTRTP